MFGIFFLTFFRGGWGEEGVAANVSQHFWLLKNLVYSGYNVKNVVTYLFSSCSTCVKHIYCNKKILFVNTIKPRGMSEAICIKQH